MNDLGKTEKELKLNKDNFLFNEFFANNMSAMLRICTKTKKIIDANKAATNLYGYTKEEFIRLKIYDIQTLSKNVIDEKMANATKKTSNLFEFVHINANKEKINVKVVVSTIKGDDYFHILLIIFDITNEKKQEKELLQKQMMVQGIQKQSSIGYWERKIYKNKILWSHHVNNILEIDKKEKASFKKFIELIPANERKIFFSILRYISFVDIDNLELETKILTGNKKVKYLKISIYKELNNDGQLIRLFGTVQDISIAKKHELKLQIQNNELEQLQQELSLKNELLNVSKKRYQTLFKDNPISLWEEDYSELLEVFEEVKDVFDFKEYLSDNPSFLFKCATKIKITNINEATKKLFQIEKKEDLSAYLSKNKNKKSITTFSNICNAIRNGAQEFSEETEFILKNKKILPVKIHIKFLTEESVAIVSVTDITEVKRIQRELTLAKENAVRSNNLKSEFLHNLSHEIRTPMNGIIGFSDILQDENVPKEKAKQYLNIIKNSGNQLLTIIDDILEISKLETKHVKIANEEVCTNCLLFELFSIFDIKAKENKTPLYLNTQISEKQSFIYSDKSKIIKIVSNLLENALKYTSEGSIEFGNYIEEKSKDNKFLHIYVKDTGIGIKKENIQTIFKRFSREKKHLSNSVSGLGLGLSIAKENAELLGGVLSVKSIENEGATFFLKIPYKKVYSEEKIEEQIEVKKDEKNITILIAEDEEVNFLFTKILIQQKLLIDCKIIHVINGYEALKKFKENENISLVLMDLKMPVMNGVEATSEIRKINSKVPIIAISAYSSDEDKNRALNAGCNNYISKPIDKVVFKDIMDKIIDDILN